MAEKVYIRQSVELEIDGSRITVGSHSKPNTVDIAGEYQDKRVSVAASSGTDLLWNKAATSEPLSDFDFLALMATKAVTVEFIVDDGNNVGEVVFTIDLAAGKDGLYGPMFLLTSDASNANAAAGFSGTADVIEKIQVKNTGSTASLVRIIMAT